jgi:hypothetical protein
MDTQTPEVWWRNPRNYIRECVEVGVSRFIWDSGSLAKVRIDPYKFFELYCGITMPWESIIIHRGMAVHIRQGRPTTNPIGVYPTWKYGESIERLEELIVQPWGDSNIMDNETLLDGWKPVRGQDHRIIIMGLPSLVSGQGKHIIRLLNELQEDYPFVTLHLHSLYSFRAMFGFSFKSVDCDPRTSAQKGKIFLPTGKEIAYENSFGEPHWVTLLGLRPVDLRIPRNRCIFNMKATQWASKNFKEAIKIEAKDRSKDADPSDPFARPKSNSIMTRRINPSKGDKILCNICTLQTACKYFREGAVCIVPGAMPEDLAKFFKTRDSDTIIEGLGTLLAAQSHRLKTGIEAEEEKGEIHPEVTRIINSLFDRGRKLAILVDPGLSVPKVAVHFGNNNTQINAATPQALMAAILNEFVSRGIPREMVTPEMVMQIFETPDNLKQKAIEIVTQEKLA